jgi:hypothetical protein
MSNTYLSAAERIEQREQRRLFSKKVMRLIFIIYGLTFIIVLLGPLWLLNGSSSILGPQHPDKQPKAPALDLTKAQSS